MIMLSTILSLIDKLILYSILNVDKREGSRDGEGLVHTCTLMHTSVYVGLSETRLFKAVL